MLMSKRLLQTKISREKKVGRPKSRWPNEVNGDAKEFGIILSWIRTLDREV